MATTGFWPIKGKLKDAINYAENPDKTTKPEFLDTDLAAALKYAGNDKKTDEQLFVTGINCSKHLAYEQMIAVKKRFGERGKNIAYHGYQSFRISEVTPEECHQIGIETAKRMWGGKFQVVVTTHLNTENLHNHFVVNSVSFRDGAKFRNKIGDHMELRDISDEICRERGKSVLENANFYGGEKGAYWLHKSGKQTHRDMLKADVEECLQYSRSYSDLVSRLKGLGYQVERDGEHHEHISLKAPGWQRAVRLDSIGYTEEVIDANIETHKADWDFYLVQNSHPVFRPRYFPLNNILKDLEYEVEHSYDTATVLVDTLFYIILLVIDYLEMYSDVMLLSPELRFEVKDVQGYVADHGFLRNNDIHTIPQLEQTVENTQAEIASLEADRKKIGNKIRRAKTPEDIAELKTCRKEITKQITPLRKKLKQAKRIFEKSPHLYELLQNEHRLEKTAQNRLRERSYSR
ncbi:MAG: relaxase/mobilization nuclease domain-containing protein [Eubacteriales bacterium]|nr:relaxase/mobilization nuclease domain-containing protein [Eubacteriales bacterium]